MVTEWFEHENDLNHNLCSGRIFTMRLHKNCKKSMGNDQLSTLGLVSVIAFTLYGINCNYEQSNAKNCFL